jgi:glutathione S-transferase kappa 1
MSPKPLLVHYYFDVLSPYQCLAWHVLQRYKQLWNINLVLHPIFLGGVMKRWE